MNSPSCPIYIPGKYHKPNWPFGSHRVSEDSTQFKPSFLGKALWLGSATPRLLQLLANCGFSI